MYNELFLKSQSKAIISNDLDKNMLNHAYLIVCDDIRKINDFASLIACLIFCEKENSPCFECVSCRKIMHGTYADVLVFPTGKVLTVDDAKSIANECYVVPIEGDKKVVIIKDVNLARTDSQNKLLKTLEEPPKNVVFILTCSNIEGVLPTIRSRVKIINETLVSSEELSRQIEKMGAKAKLSNELVECANGSITRLEAFQANPKAKDIFELCFDILKNMKKSGNVLEYSFKLLENKECLEMFFYIFEALLRDLSVSGVDEGKIIIKEKKDDIIRISQEFSAIALKELADKCVEVSEKLKFNCNQVALVDNFLLYVLEVKYLCRKI